MAAGETKEGPRFARIHDFITQRLAAAETAPPRPERPVDDTAALDAFLHRLVTEAWVSS